MGVLLTSVKVDAPEHEVRRTRLLERAVRRCAVPTKNPVPCRRAAYACVQVNKSTEQFAESPKLEHNPSDHISDQGSTTYEYEYVRKQVRLAGLDQLERRMQRRMNNLVTAGLGFL